MKKQTKVKRLFKRFDERINSFGDKILSPPYALGLYGRWDAYFGTVPGLTTTQELSRRNAEGFMSQEIVGELTRCSNGFHAIEARELHNYHEPGSVWYEIELYKCLEVGGKWVGRRFKILKRIPVKTLAKLCSAELRKVKK